MEILTELDLNTVIDDAYPNASNRTLATKRGFKIENE